MTAYYAEPVHTTMPERDAPQAIARKAFTEQRVRKEPEAQSTVMEILSHKEAECCVMATD